MSIILSIKYAWIVLRHKFYVLRAGMITRAPILRLLIHDWTKFTPSEFPHYCRQFKGGADNPIGWATAWLHHQNHNPHHPEYWVTRSGLGVIDPAGISMPVWAIREMIADWMAAGRVYAGSWPDFEDWVWLNENYGRFSVMMHPDSIMKLHAILKEIGVSTTKL